MAVDLFIAYDLISPGQNYDSVRDQIKTLGPNWQFQYSLFYVHTHMSPQEAYAHVISVMDTNDKLAVIIATGGLVTNWDHPPIEAINSIWSTY